MSVGDDFVAVARQPGGTVAMYHRDDISGLHWDTVGGGRRNPTPGYFVHGYVACNGAVEGSVDHSGTHGACPHSIKVCVIAKYTPTSTMTTILDQVGPKPIFDSAARRAIRVIEDAGAEGVLMRDLRELARLSNQHERQTLDRIERNGDAFRSTETRADSAGRQRPQIVWRAAKHRPVEDDRSG